MNLQGRTILITGASRGLGQALAVRLSRHNPQLILVARDGAALAETQARIAACNGHRPLTFVCDVSRARDIETLSDRVCSVSQRIDVLVNNAGVGCFHQASMPPSEEMRKQMEVNFFGAVRLIAAFMPRLTESSAGYILNVGSLLGKVPLPGTSSYAASKAALHGYTLALQRELAGGKVRAGLILPGPMSTAFHDRCRENAPPCPAFMRLRPDRVASVMERMIRRRESIAYAFPSTLWLLRLGALLRRQDRTKMDDTPRGPADGLAG